jgi:hypothetical protein
MVLLNFDGTPENLITSTNDQINQQKLLPQFLNATSEDDVKFPSLLNGGERKKKESTKSKAKPKSKEKKEVKPKKVKLIDTFLKTDLVKIAKKHDVSLKTKDGNLKTKEQLFDSLKRKKLV